MIRSTTKCVMIYDVWSTKIKVYNYVNKYTYDIRYNKKNLAIDIKYCQIEDSHRGKKTTLSHILIMHKSGRKNVRLTIEKDVQDFSPELSTCLQNRIMPTIRNLATNKAQYGG